MVKRWAGFRLPGHGKELSQDDGLSRSADGGRDPERIEVGRRARGGVVKMYQPPPSRLSIIIGTSIEKQSGRPSVVTMWQVISVCMLTMGEISQSCEVKRVKVDYS